jgi:hypothetical protein
MRVAHCIAFELTRSPIPPDLLVLHWCDNKKCCRPNHLFLGTHADNMTDRNRKQRQARGSRHGAAKLTEKQVIEIRELRRNALTQQAIAVRFGVHPTAVLTFSLAGHGVISRSSTMSSTRSMTTSMSLRLRLQHAYRLNSEPANGGTCFGAPKWLNPRHGQTQGVREPA